ncbi:NAD(P)/FAD-dependent oxidoreductase [Rhizobium sp. PL01]|uniref:NAD(P)/FAD-dependent oxidoreductase n=1 Tax=Rhizobium sp. PL01 TaxID=3085631 RepID=UPI002981AE0B|nr:FAD-dependent oxidoreductase [Rhizobium sp. PL01]MDW5316370.1 FAD-dependent oxidoreductase [Rhizobium sp. PL01]
MSHIVIIGAGECGARAAFALREKGFDGEITLVGAEEHLPYERPPLSKDALLHGHAPKLVSDAQRYGEAGITILTSISAENINTMAKTVRLSDGSNLAYDQLLLTTGSRPRPFPGLSDTHQRIRTLRTHGDAVSIRAALQPGSHLVIIGGGFIGLELAATARKLGARVTVIEGLSRILSRGVPEELAAVIAERHTSEGVEILCGVKIRSLEESRNGAKILLEDNSTIAADLIVVGIGAVPNVELARDAGLEIDNGIAVDAYLRTSAPDIFAAGDCCSFPLSHYGGRRLRLEAWRNAQEQGLLAAANLLGAGETTTAIPWFWSDQYDLTLQIAGLADGAVQTVRREMADGAFILFHLDGGGRLIAASGIGHGNTIARDIRLAEMMIAAGVHPDPAALAAPATKLKSLLAA